MKKILPWARLRYGIAWHAAITLWQRTLLAVRWRLTSATGSYRNPELLRTLSDAPSADRLFYRRSAFTASYVESQDLPLMTAPFAPPDVDGETVEAGAGDAAPQAGPTFAARHSPEATRNG